MRFFIFKSPMETNNLPPSSAECKRTEKKKTRVAALIADAGTRDIRDMGAGSAECKRTEKKKTRVTALIADAGTRDIRDMGAGKK
jgi:hypothetical protein